jgi:hypothetical protein
MAREMTMKHYIVIADKLIDRATLARHNRARRYDGSVDFSVGREQSR